MEIFPVGARPAKQGNPEWFTGRVWLDHFVQAPGPNRTRASRVFFEPGARTAWHSHPLGQTLYVTAGVGLICVRNCAPRWMRAGDTVWIPPGEEHWHGATAHATVEHLAIQEAESGYITTWMEHVADEDYRAPDD